MSEILSHHPNNTRVEDLVLVNRLTGTEKPLKQVSLTESVYNKIIALEKVNSPIQTEADALQKQRQMSIVGSMVSHDQIKAKHVNADGSLNMARLSEDLLAKRLTKHEDGSNTISLTDTILLNAKLAEIQHFQFSERHRFVRAAKVREQKEQKEAEIHNKAIKIAEIEINRILEENKKAKSSAKFKLSGSEALYIRERAFVIAAKQVNKQEKTASNRAQDGEPKKDIHQTISVTQEAFPVDVNRQKVIDLSAVEPIANQDQSIAASKKENMFGDGATFKPASSLFRRMNTVQEEQSALSKEEDKTFLGKLKKMAFNKITAGLSLGAIFVTLAGVPMVMELKNDTSNDGKPVRTPTEIVVDSHVSHFVAAKTPVVSSETHAAVRPALVADTSVGTPPETSSKTLETITPTSLDALATIVANTRASVERPVTNSILPVVTDTSRDLSKNVIKNNPLPGLPNTGGGYISELKESTDNQRKLSSGIIFTLEDSVSENK